MYNDSKEKMCPTYKKCFCIDGEIHTAKLYATARGVYDAYLNGRRIGNYVLAPGWTVYEKRHQYQEYDVTELLQAENELIITVANGWYQFEEAEWLAPMYYEREAGAIIAVLQIIYADGRIEIVRSDESWQVGASRLLYSDIYNGEIYDAAKEITYQPVRKVDYPKDALIIQEGEIICEHERIKPLAYIITPKGENVLDFGQNLTGYVEFTLDAKEGERVKISHAEILDKDGNFYTENYRKAKAKIEYICKDGIQTHKPSHNFYGFRYIRLDEYPCVINPEDFKAIVVHSDIKRTGFLNSGNEMLNQLFSNIIWGQKSNYLDIPTDCPQRDERLGWTGDAQVFMKAACYNYNVKRFFSKWLGDLVAEQFENGLVTQTVPDVLKIDYTSSAWGDAAVICPWQLYLMYGDIDLLKRHFSSMKNWIRYVRDTTKEEFLWIGGTHHGDHLSIDGPEGSYCGLSDHDFIASAFYINSVSLVIKAGKVLGEDVSYYEELHENSVAAFRKRFPKYKTQTEHTLALVFQLAPDCRQTADDLAELVHKYNDSLTTGFVGTPYLLHALSEGGYTELAYTILLREEYPSWLFSVKMGATTVWEHWDGMREDGSVWDSSMNSFNHYSYGAVLDWIYEVAAGIQPVNDFPGFEKIQIAPHPDMRLGHLEARLDTMHGVIRSFWVYQKDGSVRYEITTPVEAEITIEGKTVICPKGDYVFYSK